MFKLFHDHPKITLIILTVIFSIIAYKVTLYKNIKYNKKLLKAKEISKEDFLLYLDNYYIENLFFTISCVLFYFIGNISWVLYLRIKAITALNMENKTLFAPRESDVNINIDIMYVLDVTFYFILFLITILVFKQLLHALFYDEVVKLHLYLSNWDKHFYYYKFTKSFSDIRFFIGDCFGKVYLFVYNVCNFVPMSKPDNPDWNECNEYDSIYEKEHIQKLSLFCVDLVKKHPICLSLFKLLRFIFNWLCKHMTFGRFGFIRHIPYLILIPIMFYDLLHMKLYYTLYAFLPVYVIMILKQVSHFMGKKHVVFDCDLSKYFYDNTLNYAKQRILLKEDMNLYLSIVLKSGSKYDLVFNKARFIKYVLNDFCDPENEYRYEMSPRAKILLNMYRHYFVMCVIGMSLCYSIYTIKIHKITVISLNIEVSLIYVLIPLFILTYYSCQKTHYTEEPTWVTHKNFNRLFWICTLIQSLIYGIILIKAQIMLASNNILWQGLGIQIMIRYTLEEKLTYLHKYFEFFINLEKIPEQDRNNFKLFLEELDPRTVIMEHTTIRDIRLFIEGLVRRYSELHIRYLERYLEEILLMRKIKALILNGINIIMLLNNLKSYYDLFYMVTHLNSPKTRLFVHKLIKLMQSNRPKRR
jgi:hypothetical protein